MSDSEQLEKVRQAIMRCRELLDLLNARAASGERAYAALFAALPQEQRDSLPEKLLQREAARLALEDLEPLRRAVLRLRFDVREIEKGFEELYDHIAPDTQPE
jgi:hypothetical protein